MNNSINLLIPEKHDPALAKRIAVLRFIALGFLFVIVLTAISLFFLIVASPLPKLRAQENAASIKLGTLRNTAGRLYLLKDRLRRIDGILVKRPDLEFVLGKLQEQMPPELQVEQLTTDMSSFSVTVRSPSLLPLQTFTENITALKKEVGIFSTISLSTLSYSESQAGYTITISAQL